VAGFTFPFLPRHLTLIGAVTIGIPSFFLALAPNTDRFRPGFVARVARFAIPAGSLAAIATLLAYSLALHAPGVHARGGSYDRRHGAHLDRLARPLDRRGAAHPRASRVGLVDGGALPDRAPASRDDNGSSRSIHRTIWCGWPRSGSRRSCGRSRGSSFRATDRVGQRDR
jgi:hypothetical protein